MSNGCSQRDGDIPKAMGKFALSVRQKFGAPIKKEDGLGYLQAHQNRSIRMASKLFFGGEDDSSTGQAETS